MGEAFASSLNSFPEPRRELLGVEPQLAYALLIAPGVIAAFAAADRIGVAVALRRSSRGSGASAGASAGVAAAAAGAATGMMSIDSSMRLSMLGVARRADRQKSADTISRHK